MTKRTTIHSLKQRNVRELLKQGYTEDAICEKYGCTLNELFGHINLLYGGNEKEYKKILKELKANEKLPTRKKTTSVVRNLADDIVSGKIKDGDIVVVPEEVVKPKTIQEMSLEELKESEAKQSEAVIALESKHKDLFQEHRQCREELCKLEKEIEGLQSQIDKIANTFNHTIENAREIEEEMEKITVERRAELAKLDEIRSRMEEMSKAVVLVSAEGLEVAEGNLELNEDGFTELYAKMRDDETYEMLRVIDIKMLAKALCVKKNADVSVDFIFNDEELEHLFELAASDG